MTLFLLAAYVASAPIGCIPDVQFVIPGVPFSVLMQLVVAVGVFVLALSRPIDPLYLPTKLVVAAFLVPLFFASISFFALDAFGGGFFDGNPVALTEYWKRTVNLLVQLGLFVFLLDYVGRSERTGWWLSKWYFALLALVVVGGVWQMLGERINLPFPALAVKDQFHGVSPETKLAYGKRLTSFLAEPSYFVAYIGDFAVLSVLFLRSNRALVVALGVAGVLVLMSYSFSGVLNFVLLASVAGILYPRYRGASAWSRRSLAWGGVLAVVAGATAFVALSGDRGVIEPYLERFENKIAGGDDIRFQTIGEAVGVWLDAGWVVVAFGAGPGMFGMFKYLDIGIPGSSNSIYVDLLVEHGIFGVVLVMLSFSLLLWQFWRGMPNSRRDFVGALLVSQIAISGLYRADFVSSRFWVLLFLAVFLLRTGSASRWSPDRESADRGAAA